MLSLPFLGEVSLSGLELILAMKSSSDFGTAFLLSIFSFFPNNSLKREDALAPSSVGDDVLNFHPFLPTMFTKINFSMNTFYHYI